MKWILLAWRERNTDVTTSAAWGIPAYETTRRALLTIADLRFQVFGF